LYFNGNKTIMDGRLSEKCVVYMQCLPSHPNSVIIMTRWLYTPHFKKPIIHTTGSN